MDNALFNRLAHKNADRFEDGDPKFFFTGFTDTRRQILRQSVAVNSNPPAQLMWYFMTPRARVSAARSAQGSRAVSLPTVTPCNS
ncbi:Tox-REase-5 domain-containing protein [Burkholderia multivorans]|uniref:Tox-REase-5 domain-containing protein n=1 Tax=Burkholderia multivorans TaxID=87883 RepID=UPI00355B2E73